MALGGVPHYLKMIERGRSATQNIAALCFDRDGQLHDEFNRLYASLFSEAAVYERTVRALSARKSGVTRAELLSTLGISSGGRLAGRLRELEEAGFIARLPPVYTRKKNAIYRLIDEHSLFFFKWIEPAPRGILATGGAAYWQAKAQSPGYKAWAGYAFEGICLKHVDRIKQSLGIDGMAAEVGTWRYVPPKGAGGSGAQIDLLFDRSDDTITLCECKYSADRYTITKGYARELKEKVAVFEARTKTKKQVQLCLITPHGMKQNTWSEDLIDQVVTSDDLFDEAI